ncbi:PIN domain-containing protein [Nocardioides nitrophenolicus]|uniref:PIN domain-containing protein n=1 Tax=Nocardioides nitrophenolicus TaxID=60489 RepID=UPI00195802C2|nr:PIN domain-containing protein [Nocardioides nitrophenolicus]MBM7515923.1 putative nucleic acid-binding protein [Nocardioides nitrophenolicus]
MAEHPAVLLDTSVVIDPPADLASIAERVAISTLSVAELASGLQSAADPVERARREARFSQLLTTYQPIPYSASAARLYGALCEAVRQTGRSPRPRRFDLLLASVAGDLGLPLLTRNPGDFTDIHEVVRVVAV